MTEARVARRQVIIEFVEYADDDPRRKNFLGELAIRLPDRTIGGVVGLSWEGDIHKGIEGLIAIRKWEICRALAGMETERKT